jgi:hypothetical protein
VSESHDDLIARAVRRAAGGVAPITLAEVTARGPIPDVVDGEPVTDAPEGTSTGGRVMVIDLERAQETHRAPEHRRPRRRWPLVAAAAAGVAALAIGFSVADEGDRVEVAPAEAPDAEPLTLRTALVDDFVDLYNTGDPVALAERFVPSASPVEPAKLADPAFQAAGDQWTRTGPCRLGSGDDVVCPIRRRDDFHGAAGLSVEEDHVFRFDGSLVERIVLLEADPWDDQHAFRAAFRSWVDAEHPEASIRWFPPVGSYSDELADMPTADGMPAALDLVDEFIAQSPDWGR